MKLHTLILSWALLVYCHSLGAQTNLAIPPEEYSLSPSGRTLLQWKGEESILNMAIDPSLNRIDTIGAQATYYLDSLGRVAGYPFLQEVTLPLPLKHIASRAFYCPYLSRVRFNKGLKSLEQWAFVDGTFTEIRLPASLHSYAEGAIMGRYLETIEVEEGSPYLAVQEGCLVDLTRRTLLLYPTGSLYSHPLLPEEVVRIGSYAFAMSPYIAHLEIPEGVTSIGLEAFRQCSSLTTLDLPSTLTQLEAIPWVDSPLDTLIIRSAFPPEMANFPATYRGNPLHLYVPSAFLGLYHQSHHWRKIALQIESIEKLQEETRPLPTEEQPYRLVGNTVMLALPPGVEVARLYDHEGTLLAQWRSSGSYALPSEVYLLRIGSATYKLTL